MEGWVNPQPGWVRSGYWTWDLSHEGPLLYQLSYPSRRHSTAYPKLNAKMVFNTYTSRMTAPCWLHLTMAQEVDRYPCILYIHDDLCIYGESEKAHCSDLLNLMHVGSTNGVIFNGKKGKYNVPYHLHWHHLYQRRHEASSWKNPKNHKNASIP